MDLNTIVILSCILTGFSMVVLGGFVLFLLSAGTRGLSSMINNLLGRGEEPPQPATATASDQQVSSGESLRLRAQQVDFDSAVGRVGGAAFGAQAAASQQPYQASFGQGAPLQSGTQPLQFNAQQAQQPPMQNRPSGVTQRFNQRQGDPLAPPDVPSRPATPSLSPPRRLNNPSGQSGYPQPGNLPAPPPFNPGGMPNRPQTPQQGGFSQQNTPNVQPLQGGFAQQNAPQQGGLQQNAPQQGGFSQQNRPNVQPLQGGFPQQNAPQQGGFSQQNAPQQGGLGEYRPSLSQGSRLGGNQPNNAQGSLRRGGQSDREMYYDDSDGDGRDEFFGLL